MGLLTIFGLKVKRLFVVCIMFSNSESEFESVELVETFELLKDIRLYLQCKPNSTYLHWMDLLPYARTGLHSICP